MRPISAIRFAIVPAVIVCASSAQAWLYTDTYNGSTGFSTNFNIYGGGATATTFPWTESGNRFLRTTCGPNGFTSAFDLKFMFGFSREISIFNDYPLYNPAVEGSFTNMQLDLDTRLMGSVAGSTATLGLLLVQGSVKVCGFSSVSITNTDWQRLSTGPISLSSFVDPSSSQKLDLSPTGAPILVCVGFNVVTPAGLNKGSVSIDIDNPKVQTNVVPEPSSLVAISVAGLFGLSIRRKKRQS